MGTELTVNMSFERFKEGTAKAADRCKQLSIIYKQRNCGETSAIFAGFANALEAMVVQGTKIKRSRGKNRTDTLAALDRIMQTNAEVSGKK
jgi:hypothetical protein